MTDTITLNPMIYHEAISTKSAHAQVIYLAKVKSLCATEIASITRYAISTVQRYIYRFSDLLEYAKKIFRKGQKYINGKAEPKPCAYIIEFFDGKGFRWLKIGKTVDLAKRCKQHLTYYKKDGITSSTIKKAYYTDDEDDALIMESILRKHYKAYENSGFLRNDRFTKMRYDAESLINDEKINAQYQLLGYATA